MELHPELIWKESIELDELIHVGLIWQYLSLKLESKGLSGISASMVVSSGLIIGLFFVYKSRKTNARLLFYIGIVILCLCFPWLGELIDFFIILTTDNNTNNSYGLHGLVNYVWTPIMGLSAIYIGVELINLKKNWYILSIIIVICFLGEIVLFYTVS